jgi:hypothetical protein
VSAAYGAVVYSIRPNIKGVHPVDRVLHDLVQGRQRPLMTSRAGALDLIKP